MSWYKAGSVTSVAGTNVITGTGTLWSNPIFGIAPGQMIFVPGAGQVVIYEILAIDSDTQIRTSSNSASSITDSDYAIVTTVSNSMSDLARRTAVQLALYQGLLQDWQQITTGTGNVIIIAPDGTEVTIPSLSQISQDISDKVSQQQLSGFGIGLPTQTTISNFDFQNFVFTSGVNYLASSMNWLNAPAGVSYITGLPISITVDYITNSGNDIGLTLIPSTVTNVNFNVYKVLVSGVVGSRVFVVRTVWSSANPVPISGGGTGDATLAGAKNTLGITALETALGAIKPQLFAYHYMDGTAATWASIGANVRKNYANPFPGRRFNVVAQLYAGPGWGETGWIIGQASGLSFGVKASVLNTTVAGEFGSIIVQTGSGGLSVNASASGSAMGETGNITSGYVRLFCWTID